MYTYSATVDCTTELLGEYLPDIDNTGLLRDSFEVITNGNTPSDDLTLELLCAPHPEGDTESSLVFAAPEIIAHGLRQVALARAVMPTVFMYAGDRAPTHIPKDLSLFYKVVATADTGLRDVNAVSRTNVWENGPKASDTDRYEYQKHPFIGLNTAVSIGNMQDYNSRIIAMTIGRHHAIQPAHEYGPSWQAVHNLFKVYEQPDISAEERQAVDALMMPQTSFDGLDDHLSRRAHVDIESLNERFMVPALKYLAVMHEFIAGANGDVGREEDSAELQMLLLISHGIYHHMHSKDSPIRILYANTWDATRQPE